MHGVLLLRIAYHLISEEPEFLRFGEGSDDAFVFDKGRDHIAQHGPFVTWGATELAELGETFLHGAA